MARRPNFPKDEALSENDLKELQQRLSLLSMSHVEDFNRESHRECCLNDRTFPAARSIQQLLRRGNDYGNGGNRTGESRKT
jgi:hypothetical protein